MPRARKNIISLVVPLACFGLGAVWADTCSFPVTPYMIAPSPIYPVSFINDISGFVPQPIAINDAGTVVGSFLEVLLPSLTIFHLGFVRSEGSTTIIRAPQSTTPGPPISTWMTGIDNLNQAVGFTTPSEFGYGFFDVYSGDHGIMWSGGQLRVIDYPGSAGTRIFGISNNGDMVGAYSVAGQTTHAFKLSNGVFTPLFPEAQASSLALSSLAFGINNRGQIVGVSSLGVSPMGGFQMEADGTVTQLQPPAKGSQIIPLGINDLGDAVGYSTPGFLNTAFLRHQGAFSWFNAPDAGTLQGRSIATGLNNAGQIVGAGGFKGVGGWSTSCPTLVPATLSVVSGDNQVGAPGFGFIVPLVMRVARGDGSGAQGVQVNFAVTSGSASFVTRDLGVSNLGVIAATGTTFSEPDGVALAYLLLGSTPGPVTITASVTGLPPVQFHAAVVAPSTSLTSRSGDGQSAFEGQPLPNPLVVKVSAPNGGPPLAGIPIKFTAPVGTASVNPSSVLTGADGTASTQVTMGSTTGQTIIQLQSRAGTSDLAADTPSRHYFHSPVRMV